MIHIKKWITDQFFFCEHGKVYSKIQTESMGISKDHPPWSNKLLPNDAGMIQHMKTILVIYHLNKLKENILCSPH